MRVLTVRQPWAWSIIDGGKDVENRIRNIAGSYRGPVAIHVALQFADLPDGMPLEVARAVGEWSRANPGTETRDLPDDPRNSRPLWYGHLGHVIGVVDLVDVHQWVDDSRCSGVEGPDGEATCSRWGMADHWHLCVNNPRRLAAPIPAKGRLGLWKPDADLLAAIETTANPANPSTEEPTDA